MAVNGPPSANKRHKADGMPPGMPPQRYPQGYPGGPPPPGYPMGWQGQYGAPPPPHGYPGQGPPGMYPQRGAPPMTPERGGYGYSRGPHPPHPGSDKSAGRRNVKPNGKSQKTGGDNPMPPQQYGGAYAGNPQWGAQYHGGPPPPGPPGQWGPHGPPPPHMQGQPYQGGWPGTSQSPPRRPRASPEMMMGGPRSYPPAGGPGVCAPVGMDIPPPGSDGDLYVSRGVGMHDDDGQSSMGGKQSDKDKGRGSYKCGRCGVPKKGHVCPYQPKVKRRSGEPAPEMKSAAVQVEMDEFMTLRRLNIRIQGYPESYATDPTMADAVVGECRPSPMSLSSNMPRSSMMPADVPMMGSPEAARSSPHQTPMHGCPVTARALNEPTKG